MGDGFARPGLDVYATMEVLSEHREVKDPDALITAEGDEYVISSETFGDAEFFLTIGEGADVLMATSAEYEAIRESAL